MLRDQLVRTLTDRPQELFDVAFQLGVARVVSHAVAPVSGPGIIRPAQHEAAQVGHAGRFMHNGWREAWFHFEIRYAA